MKDQLIHKLNPPGDWNNPDWLMQERLHNWRNYASEDLKAEWDSFTIRQKIIISANLDEAAGNEDWN